jgi:hypothetical protein
MIPHEMCIAREKTPIGVLPLLLVYTDEIDKIDVRSRRFWVNGADPSNKPPSKRTASRSLKGLHSTVKEDLRQFRSLYSLGKLND